MPDLTANEFKKKLETVAVVNSFKVVFPWGFKIIEFKGENVLQPLTPEEYKLAAANDPGKTLTRIEMAGRPRCECKLMNNLTLSPICTERGGGWCSYHFSDGNFYSICSYL